MPLHYSSFPDSVSTKTIEHYLQMARRGEFAQFDYGRIMNMARYGQSVPPPYRLGDIEIPVHLFYGKDDRVSSQTVRNIIHEGENKANNFVLCLRMRKKYSSN